MPKPRGTSQAEVQGQPVNVTSSLACEKGDQKDSVTSFHAMESLLHDATQSFQTVELDSLWRSGIAKRLTHPFHAR